MNKKSRPHQKPTIEIIKEHQGYYWFGYVPISSRFLTLASVPVKTNKQAIRLARLLNPNFYYVIVPIKIR